MDVKVLIRSFVLSDPIRQRHNRELIGRAHVCYGRLLFVLPNLYPLIKLIHLSVELFDLRQPYPPLVDLILIRGRGPLIDIHPFYFDLFVGYRSIDSNELIHH